jgi:hypothetical protein
MSQDAAFDHSKMKGVVKTGWHCESNLAELRGVGAWHCESTPPSTHLLFTPNNDIVGRLSLPSARALPLPSAQTPALSRKTVLLRRSFCSDSDRAERSSFKGDPPKDS